MKTSKPHTHAPYHLNVRTEDQHSVLRRLLVDHYRSTLPEVWTRRATKALLIEMDHAVLHCDCLKGYARRTYLTPDSPPAEPYLGDMP